MDTQRCHGVVHPGGLDSSIGQLLAPTPIFLFICFKFDEWIELLPRLLEELSSMVNIRFLSNPRETATSAELPTCAEFLFNPENLPEVKAILTKAGFNVSHWLLVKQQIMQQQHLRAPPPPTKPRSDIEIECEKFSSTAQALMKVCFMR